MHKVRLTPAAKEQLKDIWIYTFDTWGEKQADAYLMAIEETLQTISTNPKMGLARTDIKTGYYSFSVNKHIIFYMLDGQFINIIGVLHERMDVQRRLTDSSE